MELHRFPAPAVRNSASAQWTSQQIHRGSVDAFSAIILPAASILISFALFYHLLYHVHSSVWWSAVCKPHLKFFLERPPNHRFFSRTSAEIFPAAHFFEFQALAERHSYNKIHLLDIWGKNDFFKCLLSTLPKCLSWEDPKQLLWCTNEWCLAEYICRNRYIWILLAAEKWKTLTFATWMDLESIVLSEISQIEKDKPIWTLPMPWNLSNNKSNNNDNKINNKKHKNKLIDTWKRLVIARGRVEVAMGQMGEGNQKI